MLLKDVQTREELISYLKSKGKNHNNYYHYTTWDSLEKILTNRSFLLTRGNALSINDQQEAIMKGAWREWNRIYIGSFSFGESENMAMWGLYGLPWPDGVRICIPKDKMNFWISGITEVGIWEGGRIVGQEDAAEVALNDIVYVSGTDNQLRFTRAGYHKTVSAGSPLWGADRAPEMTGYVKSFAWQYENEVRLRICLKDEAGPDKICIPIPQEVLDAMTFTTGPSFIWKPGELYQQLKRAGRIRESDFLHLVNYRHLCSMCRYGAFEAKEKPLSRPEPDQPFPGR